jgi:CTP synthase
VCRSEVNLSEKIRSKISMSCWIPNDHIIEAVDVRTTYEVPEMFRRQKVDDIIFKYFGYNNTSDLKDWNRLATKIVHSKKEVNIWIVGKYIEFKDTYKSITEALIHAWVENNVKIKVKWVCSDELEKHIFKKKLRMEDFFKNIEKEGKLHGILVPWGFWERWIEWKIETVRFARENNIPFLWICLWMQVAVIEYTRNVCGLVGANSGEFDSKAVDRVIDLMEDQKIIKKKWGTMRLGAYDAILNLWSLVANLYGSTDISERHRHRYEVNVDYHNLLQDNWLILSWLSPDKKLVEFIELKNHPFFVATQAHPEFKSRIDHPHPLFVWFVRASILSKN